MSLPEDGLSRASEWAYTSLAPASCPSPAGAHPRAASSQVSPGSEQQLAQGVRPLPLPLAAPSPASSRVSFPGRGQRKVWARLAGWKSMLSSCTGLLWVHAATGGLASCTTQTHTGTCTLAGAHTHPASWGVNELPLAAVCLFHDLVNNVPFLRCTRRPPFLCLAFLPEFWGPWQLAVVLSSGSWLQTQLTSFRV